jgi:hypothetical protein
LSVLAFWQGSRVLICKKVKGIANFFLLLLLTWVSGLVYAYLD